MITRDGHYTAREMLSLLKLAKERSLRDYVLYIVLFGTGRRIYEVCRALHVKDIDFEHKTILWSIEKRFKRAGGVKTAEHLQVNVPASDVVLATLKHYIAVEKMQDEDIIFPISQPAVWKRLRIYLKDLGIENKKRIVHAFRHSFALRYAQTATEPLDLYKLKELMAHGRIDSTTEYFKYTGERKTRERLNELFPSAKKPAVKSPAGIPEQQLKEITEQDQTNKDEQRSEPAV